MVSEGDADTSDTDNADAEAGEVGTPAETGHSAKPRGDRSYLVAVKRSARRRNATAGEHVKNEGRHLSFGSKGLAREWAREHSTPGKRIWIQDSNPTDSSLADGYCVGGRRSGAREATPPGTQTSIGPSETTAGGANPSG